MKQEQHKTSELCLLRKDDWEHPGHHKLSARGTAAHPLQQPVRNISPLVPSKERTLGCSYLSPPLLLSLSLHSLPPFFLFSSSLSVLFARNK